MKRVMQNTGRNVVDFSKWNTIPDYARRGFKTSAESWEGFSSHQRQIAPEAFANADWVQRRVAEINAAARAKKEGKS